MVGAADGCCDDLCLVSVVLEDRHDLCDEVASELSDVVETSDEGGHECGSRLCCQECLERREDECYVDLDALG